VKDALELACGYLNKRERTVAEVRRHLENRGCDEQAIDQAVEALQRDGLLDDARYARMFTEDKRTLEHWGSERIARALRERGIERELVDSALAQAGDEHEDELGRALALLRRRFAGPPRDRRDRDRAFGILVRKGYDSELASDALTHFARTG
jgi:regulatory protein